MADIAGAPESAHHPPYPPQDSPIKTDLVLRSSDGKLFHVHSTVLAIASPVFHGMFSTQRSASEREDDPVDMSESSQIIATLLDLLYPGKPNPTIDTLVHLFDVAVAAEKYNMQSVFEDLQSYILLNGRKHCQNYHSVAAYAVARRFSWTKAIRVASDATLEQVLARIVSERSLHDSVGLIDGLSLIQLQDWHRKRFDLVSDALDSIDGTQNDSLLYVIDLSWRDLHMEFYTDEMQETEYNGRNEDCDTFHWDPFSRRSPHGDKWDTTLALFKDRVRTSLESFPSGENIMRFDFWQTWEFENMKCEYCGYTLIRKAAMQDGLYYLISMLPQYPGDKQAPRTR